MCKMENRVGKSDIGASLISGASNEKHASVKTENISRGNFRNEMIRFQTRRKWPEPERRAHLEHAPAADLVDEWLHATGRQCIYHRGLQ